MITSWPRALRPRATAIYGCKSPREPKVVKTIRFAFAFIRDSFIADKAPGEPGASATGEWEGTMKKLILGLVAVNMVPLSICIGTGQEQDLASAIRKLDANVFHPNSDQAKALREMIAKEVRARRDAVNQHETKLWDAIK